MKKLLITGGAGFIGSNFIRHMVNKYPDYRIVNLDKLTYCGNLENLKDIEKHKNYKFVKGDITDAKLVNKLVGESDIVINFAAESHVDRSITDPGVFVRTNVLGTYTLLEAARKAGVELFCQISTDEVYGSVGKGFSKEIDVLDPRSPYSASKAGADLLVRSYFVTFKLPVAITRSSNNFGPYQYPEKIIPLFITNLMAGKKVPVYADGMNMRDWLYVVDNCEAIDVVLHRGSAGEIYNIGIGGETTNLALTKMLLDILGKDESSIEFVKDRPGHDKRYALDVSKLKALDWKPRHEFKAALEETVAWYKDNEAWWRRLVKSQ
ncbi:MAG: dTDP-glucose 4,6-dehydratase [Candidatus Omnitrophica bacterium]|nr:dTDP-glucose 4,6-dehydratase [Candidatus Omnitrophota bacterium]MBU0895209.1 dTDP-glucose 4,6-dehydratase [Candidatus Omnitrophota bacterium]MBU1808645.1 dTDP-glucose 4,6-dehydratase [Candidatus Omnitrophota bacterium]